jgi:hypothetical protein
LYFRRRWGRPKSKCEKLNKENGNVNPALMKLSPSNRMKWLLTVLAVVLLSSNAHAGWGSIRSNNRGSAPARPAPRPQPQMRQPQPVTRESQPARQPQPMVRPEQPRQEVQPAREPARPAGHFQAPAAIEQARAEEADHRRMDVAPERSQAAFWSGYRPGMRIDRLPDGFRRIGIRGHAYFYFGGLFYDEGQSGYVIIAPPIDAEIPELPPGAETVVMGDTIYYYAAGAFYVQQPDGSYVVVTPPLGVTVSLLPPDAVAVIFNGATYYQAAGTYYLPVMQNGVVAYLTVPQP